jgi:hypothetical protein
VADQYGSNLKTFPRLAGLGRFAILAEVEDVDALGKVGGGLPPSLPATAVEEASLLSGETVSQVTDAAGPGLRSSPLVEPASPTWTSSARVADAPADPVVVSAAEVAQGPGPELDLHGEVTAAVSLVQGKRTKVVPVPATGPAKASKKKAVPATPVRKSSRTAGAAAASVMKKAQNMAATKNLELPSVTGTDADFSLLPSLPDTHLSSVVLDSAIVFAPGKGTPQEALQLIRAKELAQASLAALAARKAQETVDRLAREAADQGTSSREDEAPGDGRETTPEASTATGQGSSDEELTLRDLRARARVRRPRITVRKRRGAAIDACR